MQTMASGKNSFQCNGCVHQKQSMQELSSRNGSQVGLCWILPASLQLLVSNQRGHQSIRWLTAPVITMAMVRPSMQHDLMSEYGWWKVCLLDLHMTSTVGHTFEVATTVAFRKWPPITYERRQSVKGSFAILVISLWASCGEWNRVALKSLSLKIYDHFTSTYREVGGVDGAELSSSFQMTFGVLVEDVKRKNEAHDGWARLALLMGWQCFQSFCC